MKAKEIRAKIKAAQNKKIVPVEIEEWNTTVYVKKLTGHELIKFRKHDASESRDQDIYLVALAACDEDGNALYTLDEIEDLKEEPATAILKLVLVAQKLNNLDEESFGELVKNLKIQ